MQRAAVLGAAGRAPGAVQQWTTLLREVELRRVGDDVQDRAKPGRRIGDLASGLGDAVWKGMPDFARENPPRFEDVGAANIAYRKLGEGPPLLFVHGWPLSGATYRKVLPELARRFTCYVPDLPGAGETVWHDATDFAFRAQARTLRDFVERLGLARLSVLAQDTGATIARELALLDPDRVDKLLIVNTEIPGHRPPWIPLFQQVSRLPLAPLGFRLLLRSETFLRSPAGFGGAFQDTRLVDGEFRDLFIRPLLESPSRLEGQLRYLQGIDWALVDSLERRHASLQARVLLVWGEDDPTFPIGLARDMAKQFRDCAGLVPVPDARLFVQEERPEALLREALAFFG